MSTTNTKFERTVKNGNKWSIRPVAGILIPVSPDDFTTPRTDLPIHVYNEGNLNLREATFDGRRLVLKPINELVHLDSGTVNYAEGSFDLST